MKTYQDLLKIGENEKARIDFIRAAIEEHKMSERYHIAFDAEEYDRQNNVTIRRYQKMLYTVTGKAVEDKYSPNHKLASNFFNRFVTQQNQYLLGNGVTLEKDSNKEKLGDKFDKDLQTMGRNALVQGVSFGFWNVDHLDTFKLTEFVPLWDGETMALMAGIRFFQIDADKPLRATLYEIDGYTDYTWNEHKVLSVLHPKRKYVKVITQNRADGIIATAWENYPGFPVIPMWGNSHHQSELVGIRENIDAYDLIKSGFGNDLDGQHIYWLLKNSGGMDDVDIAKMLERIRVLGAAAAEDESEITAHEVTIPYESRVAYLDRLEQDMYNDYQALNVMSISSGNKTATEINASYQPMDNKADQFEYCVLDFLENLFAIVGIDDAPTFTRNKVANQNDAIQTLMMAAEYLDEEFITREVCAIWGKPDAAQEILDRKANMDVDRLIGGKGGEDVDNGKEAGGEVAE